MRFFWPQRAGCTSLRQSLDANNIKRARFLSLLSARAHCTWTCAATMIFALMGCDSPLLLRDSDIDPAITLPAFFRGVVSHRELLAVSFCCKPRPVDPQRRQLVHSVD